MAVVRAMLRTPEPEATVYTGSHSAPPPVATKPPPEPLMLSLLGTIAGDSAGVALFAEKGSQEVVRLRTGESHQGWVLRSVHGREAMLHDRFGVFAEKTGHDEDSGLAFVRDPGCGKPFANGLSLS